MNNDLLMVIFEWVAYFIISYMAVIIVFYFSIFLISARQLRKHFLLDEKQPYEELLTSQDTKPISIIVPAYNEEIGIYNSVRSLLSINYPEYEIIVVNDGSKDGTVKEMVDRFQMVKVNLVVRKRLETQEIRAIYKSKLYDYLFLIDKENGGKSDALNAGINLSNYPYVCSLDGDSVLERDAFLKVMKPIIDSNGEVIVTGGSIRIANGCQIERGEVMKVGLAKSPLVVMQVVEYLRAFLMGRIGLSRHNLLLIVSGAFGVFHKEWVVKAGGYRTKTVGEDMELIVRLHRLIKDEKSNKRIEYVPDPVCWTEAPDSLKILRRQRSRWHRGLYESLWLHKKMIFNPKYGLIGFISMPYFLFIELLSAVIEFIGYLIVIIGLVFSLINIKVALLLFLLSFLYGSILSMSAVLLEEWSLRKYEAKRELARLFFYSLTEAFWYRPLTVIWRFEGFVQAIFKREGSWGEMTRKGISK
ncbi:MAG: glycosyltransferase family 2 protein [Anaerobacillus sp.]|uniref:glycosyltransferase family 2 protein n=1 Tax=Anaerobacillus sp. TaxID=1872506 RepID=UPI00391DDA19